MSAQEPASPSAVPEWTLPDRLRKARLHAGLEQTELESMTGISRASISNYENGRTVPSKPVLLSWAMACGVDLDWLSGTGPAPGGRGDPDEARVWGWEEKPLHVRRAMVSRLRETRSGRAG